jgi:hypothetical protein
MPPQTPGSAHPYVAVGATVTVAGARVVVDAVRSKQLQAEAYWAALLQAEAYAGTVAAEGPAGGAPSERFARFGCASGESVVVGFMRTVCVTLPVTVLSGVS